MGRKSKRGSALRGTVEKQTAPCCAERRYKAGIYARISSEQGEDKKESVEVQIAIAKKFIEEFNQNRTGEVIDLIECYTDLGKTGSNFEREGFLRLLQDIRLGGINCVIVKDLSRFGRNYLEAGNYIEKIFPFLGVRFIAVADGYDTGKEGNENEQMTSEIKNLINDMYAKDFSRKAKIQLKQRREEGSYVGGPPPYGYKVEWKGKKRVLEPDENAGIIVRLIYEKFVETESYTAVADELNRRHINPPGIYKKTGEVYHISGTGEYKGWDKSAIERIVKSDTYVGILVQGKTSITARNEKNRVHKPEKEWVVTIDAHESIVDRELYQKSMEVRQRMQKKSAAYAHPTKGCPLEEDIFAGVLYCGVCGRKMTRHSHVQQYADGRKARHDGYFCLNGGQTKVAICLESNYISKKELVDILLSLIRLEFAVFLNEPERYIEHGNKRMEEVVKKAEWNLQQTEQKIRRFQEAESSIYMDYRAGKIEQKDYVSFKMQQESQMVDFKKQKEGREKEIEKLNKLSTKYLAVVKALLKLKNESVLTKDMIDAFISKIYVYPGKRVEVLFAFTADFMD